VSDTVVVSRVTAGAYSIPEVQRLVATLVASKPGGRIAEIGTSYGEGAEAIAAALEPLEARGIIVADRGRIRVRDRNVLRYYARTLDHLLASPSRRTH
jgi:predicted O-methyltransferase YrrM